MKVKYSAIGITNMSGKSGGSVAAYNRHGSYIRRWAKPTNPQSNLQTAVRSSFGAWSRAFGQLSQSARDAWKVFGQENPRTDRLGDSRPMSALNAFMSANQNRAIAGYSGQLTSPEVLGFAIPALLFNEASTSFVVDKATGELIEGELGIRVQGILTISDYARLRLMIRFAKVSNGSAKSYGSVKNLYSNAVSYTVGASTSSYDISEQLNQLDYMPGDRVFVEAYFIAENGLASERVTQAFVVSEE